ncbi:hypothetical protein MSAR_04700 [Mycolicibacterium sarraceniae]|uniref:Uncharacterized protein n=1 Tax=Mycolicibacterium sarraceniae TaxID=1534348 RepID=A0A7I7SK42_9MYCO|nr:hypothetical protein MSAR_04700 [Mycolicibacterium sarraceniae]
MTPHDDVGAHVGSTAPNRVDARDHPTSGEDSREYPFRGESFGGRAKPGTWATEQAQTPAFRRWPCARGTGFRAVHLDRPRDRSIVTAPEFRELVGRASEAVRDEASSMFEAEEREMAR